MKTAKIMIPYMRTKPPASRIVPFVPVANKAPPTIRAVMALIKTLIKEISLLAVIPPSKRMAFSGDKNLQAK